MESKNESVYGQGTALHFLIQFTEFQCF